MRGYWNLPSLEGKGRLVAALGVCAGVALVGCPRSAAAQQVTNLVLPAGPPRVTALPSPSQDAMGSSDPRVPAYVLDPIRMALFGTVVPHPEAAIGCGDGGSGFERAGLLELGANGLQLKPQSNVKLIPRLTLSGFSRGAGCPADRGFGGALTYVVPISQNVFLAASLGVLHLPQGGPAFHPATRADARLDLVMKRPSGRTYAVGIGTRGLTFGGTL